MRLITSKSLNGESGMSLVVGLVLLAAAGVLITLGIYVRHHQTKGPALPTVGTSSPSSGAASQPPPAAANNSKNGAPTSSPAANQNVITIGALGAEINVPDSIKDLTYYVATNSSGHVVVNFSTQTLSTDVPACAASQGTGAFDSVERGNGQYPGPTNASSGGLLKQYPTYYLAYILPSGPCAKGLSPADQNLLDAQSQDFYSALSTVQASP